MPVTVPGDVAACETVTVECPLCVLDLKWHLWCLVLSRRFGVIQF